MASFTDEEIKLDQLQIKLDNPRHEKKDQYPAAMKELVDAERVVELALHIAEMGGLNPMDRIGVVRDDGSPNDAPTYIAAEGNRRVAALMLLDDPERLPPNVNQRSSRAKRLKKAGRSLEGLDTIRVVVFTTFDAADPWIDVMHVAGGTDGGRRRWNPTQQTRRNGETGNVDAVTLIAVASKVGLITKNEADGIAATNVQRIVSSSGRRKQLGLSGTGEDLKRFIAWDAFRVGLDKLMRDQIDRLSEHNSRALNNADKLNNYVASLVRAMGAPEPLPKGEIRPLAPNKAERETAANDGEDDDEEFGGECGDKNTSTNGGNASGKNGDDAGNATEDDTSDGVNDDTDADGLPNSQRGGAIEKSTLLGNAIVELDDANLTQLYGSITRVSARKHPVLVCIGCSTLIELLFKKSGWDEKGKIVDRIMALPEVRARYDTRALGSVGDILKGLRGRANLSKHNAGRGGVYGDALIQDMETLNEVFTAVAELAVEKKRYET